MSSQPDTVFRFTYDVPVRFRDLDPMGHAHHSLPLVYIEEARAAYWRDVAGRHGLDAIDYVLGEITVRFRQRIHFPATLSIGVRVSRMGNASFTMDYEIRNTAGELLVTAQTQQVMYDYEAGSSMAIPPEIRAKITEFEAELEPQGKADR
ncbi:MAG: acyl-CoA thioesterase [Longimicrobiales bacterium]